MLAASEFRCQSSCFCELKCMNRQRRRMVFFSRNHNSNAQDYEV